MKVHKEPTIDTARFVESMPNLHGEKHQLLKGRMLILLMKAEAVDAFKDDEESSDYESDSDSESEAQESQASECESESELDSKQNQSEESGGNMNDDDSN